MVQFELVKRKRGHLLEETALDVSKAQMERIHALWGNLSAKNAYPELLIFTSKIERDQVYLRHAAVTALQHCATPDQLARP